MDTVWILDEDNDWWYHATGEVEVELTGTTSGEPPLLRSGGDDEQILDCEESV